MIIKLSDYTWSQTEESVSVWLQLPSGIEDIRNRCDIRIARTYVKVFLPPRHLLELFLPSAIDPKTSKPIWLSSSKLTLFLNKCQNDTESRSLNWSRLSLTLCEEEKRQVRQKAENELRHAVNALDQARKKLEFQHQQLCVNSAMEALDQQRRTKARAIQRQMADIFLEEEKSDQTLQAQGFQEEKEVNQSTQISERSNAPATNDQSPPDFSRMEEDTLRNTEVHQLTIPRKTTIIRFKMTPHHRPTPIRESQNETEERPETQHQAD